MLEYTWSPMECLRRSATPAKLQVCRTESVLNLSTVGNPRVRDMNGLVVLPLSSVSPSYPRFLGVLPQRRGTSQQNRLQKVPVNPSRERLPLLEGCKRRNFRTPNNGFKLPEKSVVFKKRDPRRPFANKTNLAAEAITGWEAS